MLNFDRAEFDYDPFPIGIARNVIDPDVYEEMIATFPDVSLFHSMDFNGVKHSLSKVNNKRQYYQHLSQNPTWQRFYDYIDSEDYIRQTMAMLKSHKLDLGLSNKPLGERLIKRWKALKKGSPQPHIPRLRSRFEFSSMPVTGGSIRPHTDLHSKVVTMVVPILAKDEWKVEYGGGTSVVWPKDRTRSFNPTNAYLDFDEVDCLKTFDFEPNQCLIFVRAPNSWHAVLPMTGNDPKVLRKTLTINIEVD